jgi:hypothetical protein
MPTFESLITPGGVVIAAGIVTALVQLLKVSFPILDAKISGATLAFGLSAILYTVTALALASTGVITSPDGSLAVFMAWLSAATSAVGIKSTIDHTTKASAKAESLTDIVPFDDDIAGEP